MLIFVMYDISDTYTRTSFINKLRYFGLKRIQKSIFVGFLSIDERLDLASEFDSFLSSQKDSIIMIPVCESYEDSILIEGEFTLPKPQNYVFL